VELISVVPQSIKGKQMPTASESVRVAEQLRLAFDGTAWHGPALLELLTDVDHVSAAAKPLPNVHSIWELVRHIAAWDGAVRRRIGGEKLQLNRAQDFPPVPKSTKAAWRRAVRELKATHDALVKTVNTLPDSRLRQRVPGKGYDFAFMLSGVAQHELYHAGQIAILKKAQARSSRRPRRS
jgi:uncharacterized damage-inducible protein DinB